MRLYIFLLLTLSIIIILSLIIRRITNRSFILIIGLILAIIVVFLVPYIFYEYKEVNPSEWSSGVYQIDKDSNGTFYYFDKSSNEIKSANTSDKNVYLSWVSTGTPVIYKGVARLGIIKEDILVYCMSYDNYVIKNT